VSIVKMPSSRARAKKKAADTTVDARAAAFGQAMHRLLEWAVPGEALPAAHVRAAAREFMLDAQQARGAAALAQRIRAGEGAWVWDDRRVDWHGNEVTLVHEGRPCASTAWCASATAVPGGSSTTNPRRAPNGTPR
jgi:ATP-dependent helicase/nuclease subunit A